MHVRYNKTPSRKPSDNLLRLWESFVLFELVVVEFNDGDPIVADTGTGTGTINSIHSS